MTAEERGKPIDDEPTSADDTDSVTPTPSVAVSITPELLENLERRRTTEYEKYETYVRKSDYASDLQRVHNHYRVARKFIVGELVQWKPQQKNWRYPAYSAPAVVVEVLTNTPRQDPDGERSIEPLDLVLGFLDGDGEFRVYPFSSRRFMVWDNS